MKYSVKALCPCCKKLLAKDGRCYNNKCAEYDPISQYFDGPSQEELEEDVRLINERMKNSNFTSADELPF